MSKLSKTFVSESTPSPFSNYKVIAAVFNIVKHISSISSNNKSVKSIQ